MDLFIRIIRYCLRLLPRAISSTLSPNTRGAPPPNFQKESKYDCPLSDRPRNMRSNGCRQTSPAINAGKDVLSYKKAADSLVNRQEKYENSEAVSHFGHGSSTARKE
mmetsp:Transcript_18977/g.41231  ORF Transcript_18977/g.41231 Transcript_18977/m.41231 type:complete len:107 (+) Transcript_18977:326-646(+)